MHSLSIDKVDSIIFDRSYMFYISHNLFGKQIIKLDM